MPCLEEEMQRREPKKSARRHEGVALEREVIHGKALSQAGRDELTSMVRLNAALEFMFFGGKARLRKRPWTTPTTTN
jgi:hypothetical protein